MSYRVSNAQNREDIILKGILQNVTKGFYVDVGANHPDSLSVTKLFYDDGWSGIDIEPNPALYALVAADRSRDTVLNMGVADKAGTLSLRTYPHGDGLSTFSQTAQDNYQRQQSKYEPFTHDAIDISVAVQPLADILAAHAPSDIHFLSVDVEGFEYEVLKGNDWHKFRPWVICIEANHIQKDWRPLLRAADYEMLFFDGLNNYYVAAEHPEIIQQFSYPEAVLLDGPIVPREAALEAAASQNQIADYREQLERQQLVSEGLVTEIDRLNAYIASQQRIRAIVRRLLVAIHRIIILNIEKLNRRPSRKLQPLVLDDSLDAEARLKALELYDFNQYANLRKPRQIMYRLVKGSYRFTARGGYTVLKSVFGVARRQRT